jgi:hypothetical protein
MVSPCDICQDPEMCLFAQCCKFKTLVELRLGTTGGELAEDTIELNPELGKIQLLPDEG